MERYRLGVDIGGTFTDFLLMDEATGRYAIAKVASTPDHPSEAIAAPDVAPLLAEIEERELTVGRRQIALE